MDNTISVTYMYTWHIVGRFGVIMFKINNGFPVFLLALLIFLWFGIKTKYTAMRKKLDPAERFKRLLQMSCQNFLALSVVTFKESQADACI